MKLSFVLFIYNLHTIHDQYITNCDLRCVRWTPKSRPKLGGFKVDRVVVDRHLLSEIEVSRYEVVQSLVRAVVVVEVEVVSQPLNQERDGLIEVEVEVFVFDGAPEAFDEDVVEGSAATVHADADACPLSRPPASWKHARKAHIG